MEPIALSISQAAKALSLGRTTVYKLIEQGQLDTVKIGRRQLVKTASLRALINPQAWARGDGWQEDQSAPDQAAPLL
jgi:excisionase family DNA binding protein